MSVSNDEVAHLRLVCLRAALLSSEWDVAHFQLRILCQAHPVLELNWALFNAVAGRARSRGYDERWLLRLLIREPTSALITTGIANHCFLSRSFKIALAEYSCLLTRFPSEPLLLLCVVVSHMQQVMSRANSDRCFSVLLVFGWLGMYGDVADQQEALYNSARAYHHLGLAHCAFCIYERVLAIGQALATSGNRGSILMRHGRSSCVASIVAHNLALEALHNLTRIFCGSGNKDLSRLVIRAWPV